MLQGFIAGSADRSMRIGEVGKGACILLNNTNKGGASSIFFFRNNGRAQFGFMKVIRS
jgi:hypothetical protein